MTQIRVQFEIASEKLPMILSLLAGEVTNIATKDMAEVIAAREARDAARLLPGPITFVPTPPPQKPPRRVTRPRRTIICILKGLRENGYAIGSVIPYTSAQTYLASQGFAETSLSPALSVLQREGVILRVGGDSFRLLTWGGI